MLQRSTISLGWHYVHPKTGRPLKQTRRFGDPRYINNEAALIKGQWGLITSDFGMLTTTQLENARLAILRRLPRGSWNLIMHTDYQEFPVIRKQPESRYGGGKSNIHHFAYKLTTGVPLFEIVPAATNKKLMQAEAEAVFMAGRVYLPLSTVVVPQGRVDEYSIFK
jgi:ribosomal protein L16/L10AE